MVCTRVPLRSKFTWDACRPLDNHERLPAFKDRNSQVNLDLAEHDLVMRELRGIQVKQGWIDYFRRREEMR